eukprot:1148648-Pelagomonas_calceolata.AAC.14
MIGRLNECHSVTTMDVELKLCGVKGAHSFSDPRCLLIHNPCSVTPRVAADNSASKEQDIISRMAHQKVGPPGGEGGRACYTMLGLHAHLVWVNCVLCCLSAGMAAQHRREREWDKGGPADQASITSEKTPLAHGQG